MTRGIASLLKLADSEAKTKIVLKQLGKLVETEEVKAMSRKLRNKFVRGHGVDPLVTVEVKAE